MNGEKKKSTDVKECLERECNTKMPLEKTCNHVYHP